MSNNYECLSTSRKRRRISLIEEDDYVTAYGPATASDNIGPDLASIHIAPAADLTHTDQEANIVISANTKLAENSVAPFLAQHIPAHHALLGESDQSHQVGPKGAEKSNTKYCYRHRPDLKCRRLVDEPSMDQLQRVR
jgi:hypothetical protein